MIKILHVISDSGIGGAGVLLLGLLHHTDRALFEPILALPEGSLLLPRARALGVRCIPLAHGADKTLSLPAIPELYRILRREKPQVLHTNAALSARLAALPLRRIVCIDTKHCCFSPTRAQTSAPARLAFRLFEKISRAHYILTAEAVGSNLALRGGRGRATVVCGGAERVLPLSGEEKDALRAEFGLPKGAFVVGYAARLERGKGHEHLIEAARLLAVQKDIRFLIVGSGSLLSEMQARAKGLKNVSFLGFRSDIGRVMNLFDLGLNCSYLSETSPLSLSESMSLGTPLVVTDIGGNAAMAKDCGIVVPPASPHALASAILRLKGDKSLYARLSVGAKHSFDAYSAESMTKKIEKLYLSLLKASRKSSFLE